MKFVFFLICFIPFARACEFYELNSGGWKVYCSTTLESDSFNATEDWKDSLVKILKNNTASLSQSMGFNNFYPLTIFVLPSNYFEQANAYFNSGRIFIKQDSINSKTLMHEMVHLVNYKLSNKGIPKWLDEGLATYLSDGPDFKKRDCKSNSIQCEQSAFYFESYQKVKNIINRDGISKLIEAMKSGADFKEFH